ncbi:hypothetical protein C8Q72DRAFT_414662 [Fomitopsis betulina]|nr:hypothetical protein C8Q72DRAFT_414662 [Fomitopsis betulina]
MSGSADGSTRSNEWKSANFQSQVGGLYVGVNFQAITFGLASLVMLSYFTQPRTPDARWTRSLIVAVWILCAFCTFINFYSTYYFLVLTMSMPIATVWAPWSLSLLIAVVACISTVIRLLLLHRLHIFHRRKGDLSYWLVFVIALIALLSLVGVAGGFGITVRLLLPADNSTARLKALFDALLVCAIAADVIFVVVQGYSLHRSRSGFKRTDSVINTLIFYTMSTGLIPTAFAFATLMSMLLADAKLTYAILYMQVGNLYLITLVTSLNHRDSALKRMASATELNYSAFGRILQSEVDASSPPTAHADNINQEKFAHDSPGG